MRSPRTGINGPRISLIPPMAGLNRRVPFGTGPHLANARTFHLKPMSICVICDEGMTRELGKRIQEAQPIRLNRSG